MRDVGNVRHGFLQLRVQIFIYPDKIQVEPLQPGKWDFQPMVNPEPPPIPKVKVRRVKNKIPPLLPRIQSGKAIMNLIEGAHSYFLDHDEFLSKDEARLVGGFLQQVHDWGEIHNDVGPNQRAEVSVALTDEIFNLEKAGFAVYGTRERQVLTVNGHPMDDWYLVIMKVVRLGASNRAKISGVYTLLRQ